MEKIWAFIKKFIFLYGLVTGALCCHLFYKDFRIDEIKEKYDAKTESLDAQLLASHHEGQALKDQLDKTANYEQKFFAESMRAREFEKKFNDLIVDNESLSRRYFNLVAMKWEEKYNAEKVACLAQKEGASLLQQRLSDAKSGQATANPQLLEQIAVLKNNVSVLTTERNGLQKLYSASSMDVTNGTETLILAIDIDKKIALLQTQREIAINKIFALNKQFIDKLYTVYKMGGMRLQAMANKVSMDNVSLLLKDFTVSLIQELNLYHLYVSSVYVEDEQRLRDGLTLSFSQFELVAMKPHKSLSDAEKMATALTEINFDDSTALKRIQDLFEKDINLYKTINDHK